MGGHISVYNSTPFTCYVVTAQAHQDCKKKVGPGGTIRFDTARVWYTLQVIPDGTVVSWPEMGQSYSGPGGTLGAFVGAMIDFSKSFQVSVEAKASKDGREVNVVGTWKPGVYSHENGNYQTIKYREQGGKYQLYLPDGKYGGPHP